MTKHKTRDFISISIAYSEIAFRSHFCTDHTGSSIGRSTNQSIGAKFVQSPFVPYDKSCGNLLNYRSNGQTIWVRVNPKRCKLDGVNLGAVGRSPPSPLNNLGTHYKCALYISQVESGRAAQLKHNSGNYEIIRWANVFVCLDCTSSTTVRLINPWGCSRIRLVSPKERKGVWGRWRSVPLALAHPYITGWRRKKETSNLRAPKA